MLGSFRNDSNEIGTVLDNLTNQIKVILTWNYAGLYLHGSLAMGCFNSKSSDIDIIVITNGPINNSDQLHLAKLCLRLSTNPFPIEISFVDRKHLKNWQHPCPFEFHYSEFWRDRYEKYIQSGDYTFFDKTPKLDPDLAAHFTILNKRGISIDGPPISEIFTEIPMEDYLSSILLDFEDCLEEIIEDPVYCTLNLIRVYMYVKEGVISSKEEAGKWGLENLPVEWTGLIHKVLNGYIEDESKVMVSKEELLFFREHIDARVEELLS